MTNIVTSPATKDREEIWWLSGDDFEEGFQTQQNMINSGLIREARTVQKREGGRITDVLEDSAQFWSKFHSIEDCPEIFKEALFSEIQDYEDGNSIDPNAEHSTYYKGGVL